jgi:hypothetical protein
VSAGHRLVLYLAIAISACAPPSSLLRGQAVKKPINVMLHLSPEVAKTDGATGGDAIVNAVTDGLDERSLQYEYYNRTVPPPPSIQIWVEQWDAGNVGDRAAAGFMLGVVGDLATAGNYVVLCKVYRDGDTKPAFERRYEGVITGRTESASTDTGVSVGKNIVAAAFGSEISESP